MLDRRSVSLDDLLGLLWDRKGAICLAALLGGMAFVLLSYALPSLYRSEAEIVVRGETAAVPDPERSFNAASVNDAVVTTEKDVLSADGLLSQVASQVTFPPGLDQQVPLSARLAADLRSALPAKFSADLGLASVVRGLSGPDSARVREERRLQAIKRAVLFESDSGSSVIKIIATTRDPQFSADIVNTVTRTYMKERLAAQSSVAQDAVAGLRRRLDRTQAETAAAEERVATLLQEPGLLEESEIPGTLRDLTLIGSRLDAAKSDLAARQAADSELEAMQASAHGDPFRLVEMLDEGGRTTAYLRQEYIARQQQLEQLIAQHGPDYPEVSAVERQIGRLRMGFNVEAVRLIRKRQADLAAAGKTVAALSKQYAELQQLASKRSASSLVLARERAKLDSLRDLGNKINDRILALVAQPLDPNARIITVGQVPLRATFPNRTLFGVSGAVFASLCVALLAFARAYSMSRRVSPADGAQLLAGPLLGALPRVNNRLLAPRFLFDAPRGKALGTAAATYYGIALHLEDVVARQDMKVLTITSGRPNEGKTTVASILAVTLASFGKRVLLVNCDLHAHFTEARSGPNWVPASDALPSVMLHQPTGVHVLELANKMADAPLYYLRSAEFQAILERARATYDLVLCDTPPVLAVPDPLLVAKYSDGVLLVVEHERVGDQAEAEEISRRIGLLSRKPICGVIVTKASGDEGNFASYTGYERWRAG